MKKIVLKFIIALSFGIISSGHAITPFRLMQCSFAPEKTHCNFEERAITKRVKKKIQNRVKVAAKVGFYTAEVIAGLLMYLYIYDVHPSHFPLLGMLNWHNATRMGGSDMSKHNIYNIFGDSDLPNNYLRNLGQEMFYSGVGQMFTIGHGVYGLYQTLKNDIKKIMDEESKIETPE